MQMSKLGLFFALLLIAFAGALTYDLWPEGPRFAVVEPDREFKSLPAGETKQLTFVVKNLSRKPMRIVGAEYS
ncbi:MAG: hypothetical protein ACJ8C4_15515 [Gemmataceae bacterium]